MSKRHTRAPADVRSLFLRLEELIAAAAGADVFGETLKLAAAKLAAETRGAPFDPTRDLREATARWPGIVGAAEFALPHAVLAQCAALLERFAFLSVPDALDALFETLVSEAAKGRKGQFFTPRFVVDFCVAVANPRADDTVLDPACGSGAFLEAARERGAFDVRGTDVDERAVCVARLLMLVRGGDPARIVRADALRETPEGCADIVLGNPPFAGEIVEPDLLERFELARGKRAAERDVLFLELAVRALRPGGTLALVLPHGRFAGEGSRYVREWLLERTQVLAVIGLGRKTFLPHTHQKANVLLARRRSAPANGSAERIFFAQSVRDGKTAGGAPAPHDLGEIAGAYAAFRAGG